MLSRLLPAILTAALALSACSSGGGSSSDAGGPATCSSDTECPAKFRCDRLERRCVCTADEACPGAFCNAFTGLCVASVPGCTDDSVCGQGQFCDRAVRSCKQITNMCGACRTDAQCGANSRCAAHPNYPQAGTFCVPRCGTSADGGASCSDGLACLARDASPGAEKLCYPSQGACGITNACTPDSRKICNADADCADASQVCDATLKWCVTKVRTCPAGDACDPQQRICVHACSVDADCLQIEGAPGYKCIANACVKQALCSTDAECNDGQVCRTNTDGSKSCAQGCVVNADCPLGQSCDKSDAKHPKCAQGCTASADCPLNSVCVGGVCKNTLSGSEGSCSQTCQTVDACPIASKCDGLSRCCAAANLPQACGKGSGASACPQCVTNGVCPSAQSACAVGCIPVSFKPCNTQAECDAEFPGTFCTVSKVCQAMIRPATCTDDASCPWRGFRCRPSGNWGCSGTIPGSLCVPELIPAKLACVKGTL